MWNYFSTFYTSPLNSADVSRIKSSSPSFLQGLMLSRYQLLSWISSYLYVMFYVMIIHDMSWCSLIAGLQIGRLFRGGGHSGHTPGTSWLIASFYKDLSHHAIGMASAVHSLGPHSRGPNLLLQVHLACSKRFRKCRHSQTKQDAAKGY